MANSRPDPKEQFVDGKQLQKMLSCENNAGNMDSSSVAPSLSDRREFGETYQGRNCQSRLKGKRGNDH